jgi:hypothetical protein
MTSEYRPRPHKLVNPEHMHTALRRIVNAFLRPEVDLRREWELREAIIAAQVLLGMQKRDVADVD